MHPFIKMYLLLFSACEWFWRMYSCVPCACLVLRGQKRASEPLKSELQAVGRPCGCLEPNSGPPEEQPMYLTVEPSF